MTKRKTYHVVPDGDDWKVAAEQAKRAAGVFEKKDEAVKRAIELAKAQELGQVGAVPGAAEFQVRSAESIYAARRAEKRIIKEEKPKYNQQG